MKIWKFGRNLLLAKFGSDRVKVSRLGMAVWAEVTSLHEPLLFDSKGLVITLFFKSVM